MLKRCRGRFVFASATVCRDADDGKLFSTFVRTGCLLAADGHTDKDIKLEGYDGRIDYQNFVLPERTTTEAASDSIAVQAVAAANALSEDAIMNLKVTELKLHLKDSGRTFNFVGTQAR